MCGIAGAFDISDAANIVYLMMYELQHRGQQACGIVACDKQVLRQERGLGHVRDTFSQEHLDRLPGTMAIGHLRYGTRGNNSVLEAQPMMVKCKHGQVAVSHNGNFPFASAERTRLEQAGAIFSSTSDTEILLHEIARMDADNLEEAITKVLKKTTGAFSLVFLTTTSLIAVRDAYGFRPLSLGKKDDGWVVASEPCAFNVIDANFVRDLEPGEMLVIDRDGIHSSFPFKQSRVAQCLFEQVYFSRPDSNIFGQSVYQTRIEMGKRLAQECPVTADIVVPVPDSGLPAAIGYSRQSQIPFEMGIMRNHYLGRTFIEPKQSIRSFGVRLKLSPVKALVQGKRVVLIDDSIVRGTTSKKIVDLIRKAGATEVHFRVSSPPIIGPCYYGIDTPSYAELIAARNNEDRICNFIQADSLGFLSLEATLAASGMTEENACTACWSGEYPTKLPSNITQITRL